MFFYHAGFQIWDAPVLSPATYLWTILPTPNKAGRWSPGIRHQGGNLPEVAAPISPYVRMSRVLGRPHAPPLYDSGDRLIARAQAWPVLPTLSGTSTPCPGPCNRVLAPLGAFLSSCGAMGTRLGSTFSS